MDKCNSWYKAPDGTVVGLWPGEWESDLRFLPPILDLSSGSALHAIRTLANPRWEDYEYESIDKTRNRLHWLGAGHTENERTRTGDRKAGSFDGQMLNLICNSCVVPGRARRTPDPRIKIRGGVQISQLKYYTHGPGSQSIYETKCYNWT
jgi:hypothetical protein